MGVFSFAGWGIYGGEKGFVYMGFAPCFCCHIICFSHPSMSTNAKKPSNFFPFSFRFAPCFTIKIITGTRKPPTTRMSSIIPPIRAIKSSFEISSVQAKIIVTQTETRIIAKTINTFFSLLVIFSPFIILYHRGRAKASKFCRCPQRVDKSGKSGYNQGGKQIREDRI